MAWKAIIYSPKAMAAQAPVLLSGPQKLSVLMTHLLSGREWLIKGPELMVTASFHQHNWGRQQHQFLCCPTSQPKVFILIFTSEIKMLKIK